MVMHTKNALARGLLLSAAACVAAFTSSDVRADSVAQVATAKRISRQTVALIDPQGRPIPGGAGSTLAKVGDVLTFVIQFTPVPNGAYRGLGGYITDYIPPNTEVVGARIVDRNGNTVAPHRGGLSCDGYGPRGKGGYAAPLVDGSMSQLYADTGVFYSTDPRTKRVSKNPTSGVDEPFLSLKNGLQMPAAPSGAGQLAPLLNTTAPYFAHNAWDLAQVAKWGPGNGNMPEEIGNMSIGYGSPVAGPQSWYKMEGTVDPPAAAVVAANVKYMSNVGPWQRVKTTGSEIGRRGQGDTPPSAAQQTAVLQCPGNAPTRVGVSTETGVVVSTNAPLPAATNAVRFALGELVVGDEYFAEISLRVVALPLDPAFGNINCAEVAGGDAASRAQDGGTGGKDYIWRYFLPAPACVSLDLLFENNVDKVLAAANSPLVNTIEAKNLTTSTMTSVVVQDCFVAGEETFDAAGTTPGFTLDTTGAGCPNPAAQDAVRWTVGTLAPGESKTYTVKFAGKSSTSNQAVFTSNTFPAPGFVATAWTTVDNTAVMRLAMTATPASVPAVPATVHYLASLKNAGTAAAATTNETVTLPAGWTYKAGTTKVNGVASAANPTQTGTAVRFAPALLPASIAVSATLTFEFDVTVPAGTTPGLYTVDLTSWVKAGQDLEDSISKVAPVAVLIARSDTPSVTSPILQGAAVVNGKSTEAAGATVTVYVNGNVGGTGTVGAGGAYSVPVPPVFAGQRIEVSVTGPGELESTRTPPEVVVGVSGTAACSDGIDNDGDGKIDSADPGCTSGADTDETDVPQCSDGIDNDGDGKIDYPNDPGCSSYLDATEIGNPACSDGVDNDGDGKVDFPADPGCSSATDTNESDIPACADGLDNDGDGKTDFPFDPGCTSALDDDELDTAGADAGAPDAGPNVDGGVDAGGTTPNGRPPGAVPPDLGGVPDDAESVGCGCGVAPIGGTMHAALAALAVGVLVMRRRRRR
ncbi:MAG: Tryptophan synthase alpha chain [Labilithrix sp.]|nr:Tryptophan synthase alpha chain [Labilithrix sp.]